MEILLEQGADVNVHRTENMEMRSRLLVMDMEDRHIAALARAWHQRRGILYGKPLQAACSEGIDTIVQILSEDRTESVFN